MYPSRKVYSPQDFEIFLKQFVRVFQLFFVSIFNKNFYFCGLIYFIVITLLHICVMFHTLNYIQIMDNIKYKGSLLMYYVSLVSIAGNFITHITANLEAFFAKNDEEKIYKKLRDINEIFATKLNYTMDLDMIQRKYIRNTVGYFVFSAILSFALSFFSLPKDGSIFLFLLCRIMSVAMIRVRRCQIAFHINFLTIILRDLQILLKKHLP